MPAESPGTSIPTVAGPWLVSQCPVKSQAWKWGSWGPKSDGFMSVRYSHGVKALKYLTACVSVTHLGLGLLAGK